MENREVAHILGETAQLLEIDGAMYNRFRSYEKTAELIANLSIRIEEIAADTENLRDCFQGIGDRMAEHIQEILRQTGDYSTRAKLLKKYPATILQMCCKLHSLGPKKVAILWKTLSNAEQLTRWKNSAEEGKLRVPEGFGENRAEYFGGLRRISRSLRDVSA